MRCVTSVAAVAAFTLAAAGQAAAGCCPSCDCPPVVVKGLVVVPPADPIYVVNQGPNFSGPGHYLNGLGPWVSQVPSPFPRPDYPYVGHVFTGYPYGLQSVGVYSRGFYSPYTGYPYADPPPRVYRSFRGTHRD
jgi:hypothetical protein